MITLIDCKTYEETLDLIDGIKTPDPVLKGMQDFYASHGIKLYNLYMSNRFGKNRVSALTNVREGYSGTTCENFGEKSLKEYIRLCDLHGVDYSQIDNVNSNKKTIGTGFYFDRIWRVELVGRIGNELADQISDYLSQERKAHKVVHSGLGVVTVFQDTLLSRETKQTIEKMAREAIRKVDKWGICDNHRIVEYDTLEKLNKSYGGSLKEYYM